MNTHLSNEELALETARKLDTGSFWKGTDGTHEIRNVRIILAALESVNPTPNRKERE